MRETVACCRNPSAQRTVGVKVQHIDDESAPRECFERSGRVEFRSADPEAVDEYGDFHGRTITNRLHRRCDAGGSGRADARCVSA